MSGNGFVRITFFLFFPVTPDLLFCHYEIYGVCVTVKLLLIYTIHNHNLTYYVKYAHIVTQEVNVRNFMYKQIDLFIQMYHLYLCLRCSK